MSKNVQRIFSRISTPIASLLFATALFFHADTVRAEAADTTNLEALSTEITTLYRAARKVISDNQALINDASKGDKGLNADHVLEKAKENFQQASGKSLDLTDENAASKQALLASVKEVMDEAQDLINQTGVGFKGFLPAIFARQVAEKFNAKMNRTMEIKLTAPKAYVRNRANRPDSWESDVIEKQFKQANYPKGKPIFAMTELTGKAAFRYILPEYYGESCLSCHGLPKGELDITGGKKEGGVLDELGGAVSLTIYK